MKGQAILFPPYSAFSYWFPDEQMNRLLKKSGIIGKITTLQKRATCRMCGKIIKPGEQAIPDYCCYDEMPRGVSGFIHAEKCIPLITAVFGHMIEGQFDEGRRISTDDIGFTEGFNAHTLEEAQQEVRYLLDGYYYGIYELCYIELDGKQHPEPVYSEMYRLTTIKR